MGSLSTNAEKKAARALDSIDLKCIISNTTMKKISAFTDDALGTMDAVAVAEAIANGKISAQEAAEAAIARAEKVNGELNAIAIKIYDTAREQTKTKPHGDFFGVPTFIKDNDNMKGLPTQLGTYAFTSKLAKRNSKFVDQYLSIGVNPLGKSTLPEFGLICSTENPNWGITRNPWNTDYTTGGSSSGSAALVASGVVPIATANDGAGSTRIPASCCGLVGLKPSRDRLINFDGSEVLPLNLGYQGVLTRTVRDTAAFYAAAEKHYCNPKLPAMGLVQHPGKKRLKVLFFDNIAEGKIGHQDADTYQTQLHAAKLMTSLGHTVEQIPFPFDIGEMSQHFLNYYGFFAFAFTSMSGLMVKAKVDKKQLENFTTGLSAQFKKNALKLPKSLRILKKSGAEAERYLEEYDLIMTPVLSQKVPKIGHFNMELPYQEIAHRAVSFASYTGLQNVTGSPAISIPMSTSSDGLPIGVQFIAPFGQDKTLLELAYEIEMAQPWSFLYNS